MAWRLATRQRSCQALMQSSEIWHRKFFSDGAILELSFCHEIALESPNGVSDSIRGQLDRSLHPGSVGLDVKLANGQCRNINANNRYVVSSSSSNRSTDDNTSSFVSAEGSLPFRQKLSGQLVRQRSLPTNSQISDSEFLKIRPPRPSLPSFNATHSVLKGPHVITPRVWVQISSTCTVNRSNAFHSAANIQKREIQDVASLIPAGSSDHDYPDSVSPHSTTSGDAHPASQSDVPSFPWKPHLDASPSEPLPGRTSAPLLPGDSNHPLTSGDGVGGVSWANAALAAVVACLPVDLVASAFVAAQAATGMPW